MKTDIVTEIFTVVDSGDAAAFSRFFTDTGRLVFGNGEPMIGHEEITKGVGAFFSTVAAIRHHIVGQWHQGNDSVIELSVDYDRLDGHTVTIPVVSILRFGPEGLVDDYRVFFDLTPVFAQHPGLPS
ncbi:MAG TPA: nuclear transport factor 2 family protein [Pseudonocardiaceae bacterium]|jgi:hypothetical protein|nr:nuclear transport factor 2 family protein [Pseudonocardiaceae bacterium]